MATDQLVGAVEVDSDKPDLSFPREKSCSHCQRSLSYRLFSRNKSNPDGLQSWCKQCIKERYNYSVDEVTVTQKLCGHCKVLKPSTDYNRNKARRDGLSVQCKTCLKEMTKSKPRTMVPVVDNKVCSTCGELKAACEFFASTRHRDGLTYACKTCETRKKKRRKVTCPTVTHKVCAKCTKDKDADHFHADPYTSSGLCRYCRDCVLEQRWSNRVLKPTIPEKKCSLCVFVKPAADFTRNTFTSDGLASWCRNCTVQATKRKRYEETAQKALEQLASGFGPPSPPDPKPQQLLESVPLNPQLLAAGPPPLPGIPNLAASPIASTTTTAPSIDISRLTAPLTDPAKLLATHQAITQPPAQPLTQQSLSGLLNFNLPTQPLASGLPPAWPGLLNDQSLLSNINNFGLNLPLPAYSAFPGALGLSFGPAFLGQSLLSGATDLQRQADTSLPGLDTAAGILDNATQAKKLFMGAPSNVVSEARRLMQMRAIGALADLAKPVFAAATGLPDDGIEGI